MKILCIGPFLAVLILSSCGQNNSETSLNDGLTSENQTQQTVQDNGRALLTQGELKFSKVDKFKRNLKPIPADSTYYIHTDITHSGDKRIIEINANELVLKEAHPQGIFELIQNQEDIEKIILNANAIRINSKVKLPAAKVIIRASSLSFTQGGQIDVTPVPPKIATPTQDGRPGRTAPPMEIMVQNFRAASDSSIHFVSNGTKGGDAGPGIPGRPGRSVAPLRGNIIADCYLPVQRPHHQNHIQKSVDTLSNCSRSFPTNGKNAQAAGAPGRGGDGGIIKSPLESISRHISTLDGGPGKYGKDVSGGKAGTPRTSYKILANGSQSPAHKTSPGRDAKAPRPDIEGLKAVEGEFKKINDLSHKRFVTPFLKSRLDYAKDLYRYDHKSKAQEIFSEIVFNSKKTNNSEAQNSRLQAARYLQMISKGLDYYSFSPSYTPSLSLEATGLAFKSEIKSSIDFMAVSRWLNVKERGFQEAQMALEKQQKALIEQMSKARSNHTKAVNEIPEVHELMNEVLAEHGLVKSQLNLIEEKIKRQAHDNLSDPVLHKAFKTASTLAKVMPAGQPAVGQIGMGIDALLSLQDDDSGSFNIKAVPDALKAITQDINWEASAKDWNEFYTPYRFSRIKDLDIKDQLETAKKMVSYAAPIFKTMKRQLRSWQELSVDPSEYQRELTRLKKMDPDFSKLAQKIESLNQKRAQFESQLSQLLTTISQTQSKVASLTLEIAEINTKNFDVNGKVNPKLVDLIDKRAELSSENLQKYHALMVRSYQHRLLKNYSHELDLPKIQRHIEKIISKSDSPFLQARQYELIKGVYRTELSNVLSDILDESLERGQELQKTKSLRLSMAEKRALNKYGEVYIDLTNRELFQPDETQLRIQDIKVYNLHVETASTFDLKIEHRGEGHLSNGKDHYYFQYQTPASPESIFRWGVTFSPQRQSFENWGKTSSQRNLFIGFLSDNTIGYSDFELYTKPAALTTLKISAETQGSYKIEELGVDLTYSFY